MTRDGNEARREDSAGGLRREIFRSQLTLIAILTAILAVGGALLSLSSESRSRDINLKNAAESVAHSRVLADSGDGVLRDYIDSLMASLTNIDVISVVGADGVRRYHSNHSLIGTVYDGTIPDFTARGDSYTEDSRGPSGSQRRAYAAVYDEGGGYGGFVLAVMLKTNIFHETARTLGLYFITAALAVGAALLLSYRLSRRIKTGLMGYEPDVFSAMYRIRDNILEAVDEGIVALSEDGGVQFSNNVARELLGEEGDECLAAVSEALGTGERTRNRRIRLSSGRRLLIDSIPVRGEGGTLGAVGVLHDRTEYERLMEDLTGTRFLVDSMRANNHDFTNKLHVILGLIQMGMYDRAQSYIENISIVRQENLSRIVRAVDDPSVAALLVGKSARASELNVRLSLTEDSRFAATDMKLPSGSLVTVLGNLIDNALEAMNSADADRARELVIGIYSRPGRLVIRAEDNGPGIAPGDLEHIFEKGFSTKGEGRGTGLWHVKELVESLGGTVTCASSLGKGTAFTVSFHREDKEV